MKTTIPILSSCGCQPQSSSAGNRCHLILALAVGLAGFANLSATPVRPLANDFVAVGESPDPQGMPLYTPSILALPGGRLVAAYERGGTGRLNNAAFAFILTSDDHGKTWTQRGALRMSHARVFAAGNSLYYLGHRGDLQVARSDDRGESWSAQSALTKGQSWHQSACNVWHTRGHVYLVMERRVGNENKAWPVGSLAPVLLRAREDADLTKRESWTFANELVFSDLIAGYKQNEPALEYFGVPFSKNMVDWCFAGAVAITESPKQARHYAGMDIDGDDLVVLSRSGDARAKSAHDGNLITFHRVRNFRALVY